MNRPVPARGRRALAASVLVVGGIAACSHEDEPTGLSRPEDATKGEEVDVDAFVEALRDSFDPGSAARVSFVVEGAGRVRGEGVVEYADTGMEIDVRISDWQVPGRWIHLRTVDGAAYMKVPESRGLWVDVGTASDGVAASVLEDADPRTQVELYRDEATEVRFSGEEMLAGRPTRSFQVTTEAAPAGDAPDVTTAPDVVQFWFDDAGRVVQRSTEVDGGRARFSWLDWEAEVSISPPPADRVISLAELERLRRQQRSRP